MDDPLDADPDITRPQMRGGRRNPTVLWPIFGAYHAARHRLEDAAGEHGLDATEALVLVAIRMDPRCPPWSIRRRLGFARSTMTSILDRLERDGNLIRRSSGFSSQRFELELTTAGKIVADLASYVIRSFEDEIAGYTSSDERRGAVAAFEACMALDRGDRPHR